MNSSDCKISMLSLEQKYPEPIKLKKKSLSIFRPYIVFVEWTQTLRDSIFHLTCASVAKIVISKMLARFWPKISIFSLKILFDIIIGPIVY